MAENGKGTSNYWEKPPGRKTLNSRGDLGTTLPPTGSNTLSSNGEAEKTLPQPGTHTLKPNGEAGNTLPPTGSNTQKPKENSTQPSRSTPNTPVSTLTTGPKEPVSSTAAKTTADLLGPWRIDLSARTPQTSPRSSTPNPTPNAFQTRRSPNKQADGTNTDAELEEDLAFGTPLVSGAPNSTGNNQTEDHIMNPGLPAELSIDELPHFVEILQGKIEEFSATFRNKVNWRRILKPQIVVFRDAINKLKKTSQELKALDQLAKVYSLSKTFEYCAQGLSNIADQEAQTHGSPYTLRPSTLATPSDTARLTTHHQSLEDIRREDTVVVDEAISDREDADLTQKGRRSSVPQALKIFEMKLKSMEIRKADIKLQTDLFNSLDSNKASKHELSTACLRISQLELMSPDHAALTSAIDDNSRAIRESRQQSEILIAGLCDDKIQLERKLNDAVIKIDHLQTEVDGLKIQVLISGEPALDQTSHLNLIGFEGNEPRYQQPQEPRISGISEYPARTSGICTTSNPGYTFTSLVMSGGTRPTTQVAPTSHTNTGHQPFPHVRQPGMIGPQPSMSHTTHTNHQPHLFVQQPGMALRDPHHIPNQQHDIYRRTRAPGPQEGNSNPDNLINHRQDSSQEESNEDLLGELDSSNERSNQTEEEELSREAFILKDTAKGLRKLLKPPVDNKLTKTIVQGILTSILPAVDSERKELQRAINSYANERLGPRGRRLMNEAQLIICEARAWSIGMRNKYNELDCAKKPLDSKLFEGLKKFSEKSDINIFDFFAKFEAFTEEKGTAKERAALLYESYLQEDVQMMLIEHKEDFQKMRSWLINRFGDIKVMTDNILRNISKDRIPSDLTSSQALTNYYRKLNSVIKRIQELNKTADMPLHDLQTHIYSAGFIEKLMGLLPEKAKYEFFNKHVANNEDLHRISGQKAFETLANVVYSQFTMNETVSRVEQSNPTKQNKPQTTDRESSPKKRGRSAHISRKTYDTSSDEEDHRPDERDSTSHKKGKSVHATRKASSCSSDEEEDRRVHFQKQESNRSRKAETDQRRNRERKPKDSSKPNRKQQTAKSYHSHPCPIKDHDHELASCKEYFKLKPFERYKASFRKSCYTCLGPSRICAGKCSAKVPKILICPECAEFGEQINKGAYNILLCGRKEHTKPDEQQVIDTLKSYLTNFKPADIQGKFTLVAHLHLSAQKIRQRVREGRAYFTLDHAVFAI